MDANEEILKRLKQAVAHEAMARETFIPDTNSSTPANIHGLTLDLKGLIIPEGLDLVMGWCSYVAQEALTDHRIFDEICSLCSKNGFKVQR